MRKAILVAGVMLCGWIVQAWADKYHAVEPGETLSSIAARYGTTSDALRGANNVGGVADDAILPAMLVRIPDSSKSGAATPPFYQPSNTDLASRSVLASRGVPAQAPAVQPPPQANLGQVARIIKQGSHIRRRPDARALSLYRCAVGTDLAIIRQRGAWSAVLMSDRSTGWIPTRYLKMLGQRVDLSSQVRP